MSFRTRTTRTTRIAGAGGGLTVGLAALLIGPGAGVGTAVDRPATTTPIQHLVVIYQENVSFDHYFATYPHAANTDGSAIRPRAGTPAVDGLRGALLTSNPNGTNPQRYAANRTGDVLTCDQDHTYTDEQKAMDNGAMDRFVSTVGNGSGKSPTGSGCVAGDVMNYYDGNTVTGLWNYAQRYAMSDRSFGTTFGPSSPGAINLVSGNTGGVDMAHTANNPSVATAAKPNADLVADGHGGYTLISDAQPYWDDCSTRNAVAFTGTNIGDELNRKGLSWGFFQGGFRPTTAFPAAAAATGHADQSTATFLPDEFAAAGFNTSVPHSGNQGICNAVHPVGAGLSSPLTPGTGQYGYKDDYIAHHQPFQYYASTANPHHLTLPTDGEGRVTRQALRSVGKDTQHYVGGSPQFDTPNHQYDVSDFDSLVAGIRHGDLPPSSLPAVSFLKAPGYQDGHAGYSDPLDEQQFIAREINALMQTPDWRSTAVVISYDDSDGWYDHAYSGVSNPSSTVADALTGPGRCGSGPALGGQQGRCGYGPRLPLLLISPYAKANFVDHTLTDQSSITRFVEDNWGLGRIPGSFDAQAGSLTGMLDLTRRHGGPPNAKPFLIDPVSGQSMSRDDDRDGRRGKPSRRAD